MTCFVNIYDYDTILTKTMMWRYFLIGWAIFVVLVYLHLIYDTLRYYSKLPKKCRKIYKALTEE